VGVRVPDPFVFEFVAVDALATCAVAHCRVATLHHEVLDNPVELVSFVVEVASLLARAVNSKVLSCLGHCLVKKFHHNSTFIVAFLAFVADLDVEEDLLVFQVEVWQLVELRRWRFLIVVDTFLKELLHCCRLACTLFLLRFLYCLKMGSEVLVLWIQFNSVSNVFTGFVILMGLHECHTSQKQGFDGLFVNVQSLGAVHDGLFEVSCVVCANAHVLKSRHLQLFKLICLVFDSLCVSNCVPVVALSLLVELALKLDVSILLQAKSSSD
jgi:hypothetical protein